MELRQAYLKMIRAFRGGWDAMAPALGLTRDGLENRIYERKGQALLVETALQMQEFSGTTYFAEAVAIASGGTFMRLPELGEIDDKSLLRKFNELYAELGALSQKFNEYTTDSNLTTKERADLGVTRDAIHRKTAELTAMIFRLYSCDDESGLGDGID